MKHALRRTLVICSAGLTLVACQGVGRELVGDGPYPGQYSYECKPPPECSDSPLPVTPRMTEPPSGFDGCAEAHFQPSCAPGEEGAAMTGAGGVALCGQRLSLDDDAVDHRALQELSCTRLALERTPAGGAGTLRLEDVRWSQLDLQIASSEPYALELVRAELHQVRLRLSGPVTVRMIDSPQVRELAVASAEPRATLDLREVDVRTLYVGTEDVPFAGLVTAQRSTLIGLRLVADQATFESSALLDSVLVVERLQLLDTTGQRLALDVGDALLSASKLGELDVARCGRVGAFQSQLKDFRIPPCSEDDTRIYGSTLVAGSIEGNVIADHSSLQRTRVGVREATELSIWDSKLNDVALCTGAHTVVLAGATIVACTSCLDDDGMERQVQACHHRLADLTLSESCEALVTTPTCDPTPLRMRPPFD